MCVRRAAMQLRVRQLAKERASRDFACSGSPVYAMSPLRNAGVFEALLRLSCMPHPLGVHGGRSTWKTAHRSRKSNNNAALYPSLCSRGPGVFPAISEGKGNRAPGHLMPKGSRVVSATRNDLTVTVAVLKVACEQWWSGEAITSSVLARSSPPACRRARRQSSTVGARGYTSSPPGFPSCPNETANVNEADQRASVRAIRSRPGRREAGYPKGPEHAR